MKRVGSVRAVRVSLVAGNRKLDSTFDILDNEEVVACEEDPVTRSVRLLILTRTAKGYEHIETEKVAP